MHRASRAQGHAIAVRLCAFTAFLVVLAQPSACAAWATRGKLELTVVDRQTGSPIPCRMHLRNAAGRARKPRGMPFWHDHFAFDGTITLELPLGQYLFELERGLEYVERTGHFTINRFADDAKEVDMLRFVDMSSHGWWSGDLHVRRPARDIELLMRADDLHVVPLITWWDGKDASGAQSVRENPLVRFDGDRYYHRMAGGLELSGGTLLFFNLPSPLGLADAAKEFPPPMVYVERARKHPNVWVDPTKPYWWDLPVLVALGQVDSIQIAHSDITRDRAVRSQTGGKPRDTALYPGVDGIPRWSQAIYFGLLNCGLRIPPSAGSGSGMAPNPVGYNRVYVHVEGKFNYENWWESLRAGRVVVTNGPLLRPTVRGQLPGHVFFAEEGDKLDFEIGLTLSTREPISYLELIKNGEIEHSVPFDRYRKEGRLPHLHFERSGWFLVRAVTDLADTYCFAVTGPYYVQIGERPRISKRSAQFFLDWVYERARQIKLDDPAQQRTVIEYHRRARDFWQERVERSNAE